MNRLRDVAKQLADGIRRESRRWRGPRAGGSRRSRVAGPAFYELRQLAQFGLGNRQLELFELLVQRADLPPIRDPEHVEFRFHPSDFSLALGEHRFELDHPRAQPFLVVVITLFRADERRHVQNDIG